MMAKKAGEPKSSGSKDKALKAAVQARAFDILRAHVKEADSPKKGNASGDDLSAALIALAPDLAACGLIDKALFGSDTALTFACSRADLPSVRALLAAGADPRVPTIYLQSPLMQCLHDVDRSADWEGARPCMDVLMAAGADILHRNQIGQSAIHWAAWRERSVDATRWLLAHGADIGAVCDDGLTALHHAAKLGKTELARLLIDAGAPLFGRSGKVTDMKDCPLIAASTSAKMHGNVEIVAMLTASMIAAIEKADLSKAIKPPKARGAKAAKPPKSL